MKRLAMLSVSNKEGLVPFAKGLIDLDFEIISTGGTAKLLAGEGIPVKKVSDVTGFPEILGGRVKTLHPKISGAILARSHLPTDQNEMGIHNIAPIHLVCVNLYPFAQTIARGAIALEEVVEEIDIGGPTMIRAAAKNFRHCVVVVDPSDYGSLLDALKKGDIAQAQRFNFAKKAFHHTASYDAVISGYFSAFASYEAAVLGQEKMAFSENLHLQFKKSQDLRYGENPHQKAAYYRDDSQKNKAAWKQLHGKELSFNNLLDMDAAVNLVNDFTQKACVIVKHNNPCGVALGESALEAYEKAFACDETSAFGGIVAFNAPIDLKLAEKMSGIFYEIIAAPSFEPEALRVLQAKKNLRLIAIEDWCMMPPPNDIRRLTDGVLVQDPDVHAFDIAKCTVVTKAEPKGDQMKDLAFAWKVAKAVKSNAIVLVRDLKTIGIGAGQMSRVDSCKLALMKIAQGDAQGAVLASDAFFPFRDGVDFAAKAGVVAMIQPGGSVRDEEVIAAANEKNISMVFTGVRHFRH